MKTTPQTAARKTNQAENHDEAALPEEEEEAEEENEEKRGRAGGRGGREAGREAGRGEVGASERHAVGGRVEMYGKCFWGNSNNRSIVGISSFLGSMKHDK
jgi:hypothetical protein